MKSRPTSSPTPRSGERELPFASLQGLLSPVVGKGLVCLILLLLLSPWDQDFAQYTQAWHKLPWLSFMTRSIFEQGTWGATDGPTLILVACVLTYVCGGRRLAQKAPDLYIKLGFVSLGSLWIAVVVHLIKGASQRPRPYQVYDQGLPFHPFYDLNAWTFHGWGHGSFPSGHTATMMSLLTFAYVLPRQGQRKILAVLVGLSALVMAFSRIAVGAHWLTDTGASILLVLLCCELLYSVILKVPEHLAHVHAGRTYPKDLLYWELKLFPRLVFGIMIPLLPVLVWSAYRNPVILGLSLLGALLLFWLFIKDLGNVQLKHLSSWTGDSV